MHSCLVCLITSPYIFFSAAPVNGCESQVADDTSTVLAFVKNAPCYDMSLQPINFSGIALKSQTLAMTTKCPFVLHSLDMTHRSVLLEQQRLTQPEQQPPTTSGPEQNIHCTSPQRKGSCELEMLQTRYLKKAALIFSCMKKFCAVHKVHHKKCKGNKHGETQ